jgi:hypothetical protein
MIRMARIGFAGAARSASPTAFRPAGGRDEDLAPIAGSTAAGGTEGLAAGLAVGSGPDDAAAASGWALACGEACFGNTVASVPSGVTAAGAGAATAVTCGDPVPLCDGGSS